MARRGNVDDNYFLGCEFTERLGNEFKPVTAPATPECSMVVNNFLHSLDYFLPSDGSVGYV